MKKVFILLSIIFIGTYAFSQSITTQTGLSITNLVQDTLINGCIQVSNMTVNNSGAYGYFNKANSSFPFKSGIIIASGAVASAKGPNSSTSSTSTLGSGGDPDLAAIASGPINDATVVQFDFIPATDTLLFNYIFGSEEFPEYANSSFNDVFGFFLSGPGISGPYSNNSINIAKLPNNQTVTINNVHNFNYYTATPTSASNSPGSYYGAVQYDGNTIVLTAFAIVQACETYHIKLAVGDVGDSSYDSGVFFEAGSFVSGAAISVVNTSQVGGASDLWEGCENFYVISREEGASTSEDVTIDIAIAAGSTATEGVDFSNFPTTITIPAGQMTDTIYYSAYNDGSDEGHETVIVSFYTACPCGNQSTAVYDTIWIYDAEFIKGGIQDVETFYCGTEAPPTLNLVGQCNIDPNVVYHWSTGEYGNTITIIPVTGATTYYLTMTDQCGNEVLDSITITVADMALNNIVINPPACNNTCNGSIQMFMSGDFPPFTYRYANSLYQFFPDSVHNTLLNTFSNLCPATYKVTVTDNVGCFQRFQYELPNPPSVNLSVGILEANMQFCENPGQITLHAESNQPIQTFLWSNSATQSSTIINPTVGINEYWVKIYDACNNFTQDFLTIKYSNLSVNANGTVDYGSCNGQVSAFAINGITPYNYYWEAPISNFGSSITDVCYGYYTVVVTDAIGCQTTSNASVLLQVDVPGVEANMNFSVFPNPTTGEFIVSCDITKYENSTLTITDIKGSIVYKSTLSNSKTGFANFESGIYFIELSDINGIIDIQKLVITK